MLGRLSVALREAVRFVKSEGARCPVLAYYDRLPLGLGTLLRVSDLGVAGLIQADGRRSGVLGGRRPLRILSPEEACEFESIDAVIVVDGARFALILRLIEKVIIRDIVVLPLDKHWVVPRPLLQLAPERAWQESVPAEYVARSGLTGHYVEFGTYWGRSFFPAYFRYRHLLRGRFFAFDSFEGLLKPRDLETSFSAGDFREHTYNFNLRSFTALCRLLGVDRDRLRVVAGYYADTLVGHDPRDHELEPRSVSVCVIDCDLYESTTQALEFITPALEPGALLYFDDWRLCRASPEVGERAAALAWLKGNPGIELVELHRTHWQHQWFIFHNSEVGTGRRWG